MKEHKFNYLIRTENEETIVSCKELYTELELAKQHWSRWYTRNIINNKFFTEGVDYQTLYQRGSGNETLDFALTLDTAKKISMTVMNKIICYRSPSVVTSLKPNPN